MEELKSILIEFYNNYFDVEGDWYNWKMNEDLLPQGINLPDGNRVFKNIRLKEQLHLKWKNEPDEKIKGQLIEYYIVKWGGIKGNRNDTLDIYKTSRAEKLISRGVNGVSSWSKALVLHDCNKYAIFDSRVSSSLNHLQIINKTTNKILFPILPSRNNEIIIANKHLKHISKDWGKLGNDTFYNFYLDLLSATAKELNTNISIIEMLLFAKATDVIV